LYLIGVPSFASIDVTLGPGAVLHVRRIGAGQYVDSATWNGTDLGGAAWLTVQQVHTAGGVLALTMAAQPSAKWGTLLPPSWKPTAV
jgi:putative alpha-1,2-mannosidase